jgi:putative flippase GtrA
MVGGGATCTRRLGRFLITGVIGLVAQLAALWVLVSLTTMHYTLATVLAVELTIVLNFVFHERWTWGDRTGAAGAVGRLFRFNALTGLTSIAGGVIVTAFLVETMGLHAVIANAISVVLLGAVNFIGAETLVFRAAVVLAAMGVAAGAQASPNTLEAQLQARTVAGWNNYVRAVEARRAQEIAGQQPFLELERKTAAEQARIMALLKRGEVYVERAAAARDQAAKEIEIDGGLINHWRGTVLVPDVTLDQVLKVLQEPQTDKHKQEDVITSRVVNRDGDSQKVYLRLKRTKFVTVVYDTEYDVDYRRLSPILALSNSISTKIVEIEHAGTARERALPEGNDHGYMWRLNSYWRYKQVAGGVLVEVESLTLSRDLPAIIGPLIRPIVNSTARESMTRTLASVRARFSS